MCTAATYKTKDFYFGRTLDYEFSYGDQIVITPRNYAFNFRHVGDMKNHYAIIGMAHVAEDYPLYYDAMNEKGVAMAGLNFVGNAVYAAIKPDVENIAQFEFIPWILSQCSSLVEVRELLERINIVNTPFSEQLPLAQLHWIISDENESITVVTSSGSDTYSVISAAMSSLKGKKHGGANLMVMNMMDDIKSHVKDYEDEEEIASYLSKILKKEAFDQKGLIYGMGHAVYSISDPRERVFKGFVEQLARDKGREKDMTLYNNIEKIAPKLIAKQRQIFKGVSPNIDFYSGFVYDMLNIPRELYTPLFAIARIAGWSAHRLEELITTDKIIRPAYKSLVSKKEYIEREER